MLTITPRALTTAMILAGLTACGGKVPTPEPAPSASVGATAVTAPAATTPNEPTAAAAQPTVAPSVAPAVPGAAAGDSAGPSISLPKAPKVRADRQLLTRDAILETQYTNLYDVILALRGTWLRSRGAESIQGKSATVQIYLDNQRLNGADELRSIAPTNIATVRYFDPIQASARWGMDHGAGAIYILTAKR